MEGGSKGAGAAGGRWVDVQAAVDVLTDVASALKYLHSMNLVHGNVTADNVVLGSDAFSYTGMKAKLCGFSACRVLDGSGRELNLFDDAPDASAPGGAKQASVGASDVHAYGALILEVLANPVASCSAGPSSRFLRALARLAADCLHSDPRQRPTMADVARTLEELSEELEAAAQREALVEEGRRRHLITLG